MMKKRNMAVAMAAVTVVTTVAPAFANTLENGTIISTTDAEKMQALKEEVKGYLDVKYSKTAPLKDAQAGDDAYVVEVDGTKINSLKDLEKAIVALDKDNESLTITVEDKGHKVIDGEVVDWKTSTYEQTSELMTTSKSAIDTLVNANPEDKVNVVESVDELNNKTLSVSLKNNDEPLVLTVGDEKLDFSNQSKAIFKKDTFGNFLDKDGKIITFAKDEDEFINQDTVVLGFEKTQKDLEEDDKFATKTFGVKLGKANNAEFTVADLYESKIDRLTSKGNKLVKFIKEYNADDKSVTDIKAEVATDGLSLEIAIPEAIEGITTRAVEDYATIVVKGTKNEISTFANKLNAETIDSANQDGIVIGNTSKDGVAVKTIAGTNRRETAIEVSKAKFTAENDANKADNVVLVSDYAIADGLAATPFANAVNAPILLTGKDEISEDVMAEIKRVMRNDGKVYLIGGDAVLSEKMESQLDAKFIKHERIKGKNRQETSLEIAKKISDVTGNTMDRVFVTGGHAQADAMSIANVAATKSVTDVDAILLAGDEGLTDSQSTWLKREDAGTDAFIIGGEAKTSKDIEGQLAKVLTGDVERIKGKNRQETNAKVINEFYTNKAISKVYVAKSDDKGLVDALPGGVLAADTDDTPVVLATEELHESQSAVLTKLNTTGATKTQIGAGVAAKVWETIKDIF